MVKELEHEQDPNHNKHKANRHLQVAGAIFAFFSLIVAGTLLFHTIEDWTWAEAFYFSVVTLTTVGYGDLVPTTDESRIAAAIFIIFGVAIAVSAIGVIGAMYLNKRENKIKKRVTKRQSEKNN